MSKLASPQAVALLRSLVMYLQYLSLSLDVRLRWPPQLLSFFGWLKALTNGCDPPARREFVVVSIYAHSMLSARLSIDLAAPECVAENWSCALRLLAAGRAPPR